MHSLRQWVCWGKIDSDSRFWFTYDPNIACFWRWEWQKSSAFSPFTLLCTQIWGFFLSRACRKYVSDQMLLHERGSSGSLLILINLRARVGSILAFRITKIPKKFSTCASAAGELWVIFRQRAHQNKVSLQVLPVECTGLTLSISRGFSILPARAVGVYIYMVNAQMVRLHESFAHYARIIPPAMLAHGSQHTRISLTISERS